MHSLAASQVVNISCTKSQWCMCSALGECAPLYLGDSQEMIWDIDSIYGLCMWVHGNGVLWFIHIYDDRVVSMKCINRVWVDSVWLGYSVRQPYPRTWDSSRTRTHIRHALSTGWIICHCEYYKLFCLTLMNWLSSAAFCSQNRHHEIRLIATFPQHHYMHQTIRTFHVSKFQYIRNIFKNRYSPVCQHFLIMF